MQNYTVIDKDDYVINPCCNCSFDTPRLCDCEVCEKDNDSCSGKDLSDLLDIDFD